MTVSELSKILKSLNSHSPKGVGVFAVAKETGLAPQTIREYLSKYRDYFVSLPDEQTYQINRFGKFEGSIDEIIKHYEKTIKSKTYISYWWLYLLFVSIFVTLISANS